MASEAVERLKEMHKGLVYSDSSSEEDSDSGNEDDGDSTPNIGQPVANESTAAPVNPDDMDIEARKNYYGSLTYSDSSSDDDSESESSEGEQIPSAVVSEGDTKFGEPEAMTMEVETEEDWDALMASYKPITRRAVGEGILPNENDNKEKKILTWEESAAKYQASLRQRRNNRWMPSEYCYDIEEETILELENWYTTSTVSSVDNKNNGEEDEEDGDDMSNTNNEAANTSGRTSVDSRMMPKRMSSNLGIFEEIASRGTRMTKHNKLGLPHTKLVRVTPSQELDWFTGHISLHDITAVQALPQKPNRFVVLTPKKQVELEASSATEQKIWVRGLRMMIQELQNHEPNVASVASSSANHQLVSTTDDDEKNHVRSKRDSALLRQGVANSQEAKASFNSELFHLTSSQGVYLIRHKDKVAKPKLVRVNHVSGVIDWESNKRSLQHAAVLRGKMSKGMKAVSETVAPSELCLCLTWEDKELDLQFPTKEDRDQWYLGLRHLKGQLFTQKGDKASVVLDAKSWRKLAEKGVMFIKHGRYGEPHRRMVRVTENGNISWTSAASHDVEDQEEQDLNDKKKKKKNANLSQAISIQPGKNTSVLKRVSDKVVSPSVCFSLTWRDRSLDLEAGSETERDLWVENLKALQQALI